MEPTLTLEFYRSGVTRRLRWRVTHDNGHKMASSSQALGYRDLRDAEHAAAVILTGSGDSKYNDLTGTLAGRPDVEVIWT